MSDFLFNLVRRGAGIPLQASPGPRLPAMPDFEAPFQEPAAEARAAAQQPAAFAVPQPAAAPAPPAARQTEVPPLHARASAPAVTTAPEQRARESYELHPAVAPEFELPRAIPRSDRVAAHEPAPSVLVNPASAGPGGPEAGGEGAPLHAGTVQPRPQPAERAAVSIERESAPAPAPVPLPEMSRGHRERPASSAVEPRPDLAAPAPVARPLTAAPSTVDDEPAIEVHIGRIEFRPPQPLPAPPPAPKPARAFEQHSLARRYLDRRWY